MKRWTLLWTILLSSLLASCGAPKKQMVYPTSSSLKSSSVAYPSSYQKKLDAQAKNKSQKMEKTFACLAKSLNQPSFRSESSISSSKIKTYVQRGSAGSQYVRFSPKGDYLYVSEPKSITLFDTKTNRQLQTVHFKQLPRGTFISQDGKRVAVSYTVLDNAALQAGKHDEYEKTVVEIIDIVSNKVLAQCRGSGFSLDGSSSQDGKVAVIKGPSKGTLFSLEVRDLTSGRLMKRIEYLMKDMLFRYELSKNGHYLLGSGFSGNYKVWDLTSGKSLGDGKLVKSKQVGIFFSMPIDHKGRIYLPEDGKLVRLDVSTQQKKVIATSVNVSNATSMGLDEKQNALYFYENYVLTKMDLATGTRTPVLGAKRGRIELAGNDKLLYFTANSVSRIATKDFSQISSMSKSINVRPGFQDSYLSNSDYAIYMKTDTSVPSKPVIEYLSIDRKTGQEVGHLKTKKVMKWFTKDRRLMVVGTHLAFEKDVFGKSKLYSGDFEVYRFPEMEKLWETSRKLLWDISAGINQKSLYSSRSMLISFDRQGQFIFSLEQDRILKRNAKTGRVVGQYVLTDYGLDQNKKQLATFSGMAVLNDGSELALITSDAKVFCLDLVNKQLKYSFAFNGIGTTDLMMSGMSFTSFNYSKSGQYLYLPTLGGNIFVADLKRKKQLILKGHSSIVTSIIQIGKSKLASSAFDGSLKVWDLNTGQELISYSEFGDKDWVTVTPTGYFNSSDQGAKYLNVEVNGKVLSIDQFREKLYRPDLVFATLNSSSSIQSVEPALDIVKIAKSGVPPKVQFVTKGDQTLSQRDVTIRANLIDQGGGVGKVEWRINGVTVGLHQDARGLKSGKAVMPSQQIEKTLTLSPGKNTIELIAYNKTNAIASEPLAINLTLKNAISEKPSLYVLIAGVNKYRDKSLWLKYAVPDSNSLAEALYDRGKSLFKKVEVVKLLDQQVTRQGLESAFNQLSKKANTNDVFVLYLAGHGITQQGRYHFLPVDFRYRNEQSVMKRAINQDDMQQWLSKIPAQKSLVLLDTCNSGSYVKAQSFTRGIEEKTAINKLTRATGRTTIAASSETQVAYEGYKGHGVFTWVILNGMKHADASYGNKDGVITTSELANYIDETVPDITYKKWGYEQVPQVNLNGRPFPVGVSKF